MAGSAIYRRLGVAVRRSLAIAVAAVATLASAVSVQAATEQVTITRDSHGEPHISAASAPGATYGFAWAQMEDQAHAVLDNLAKSVGRSAELSCGTTMPGPLQKCFEADQMTHLFRVPEAAKEKYPSLPPEDKRRLEAFAEGINDYVAANPAEVPAWAQEVTFTGSDIVASVEWRFVMAQLNRAAPAFRNFDTGPSGFATRETESGQQTRLIDLFSDPDYRIEMNASNMFAVDGSKTASGKPMLNGGPHLGFDGDTQWYQAQVSYPGVSIEGATFRGIPGIAIGSNGHLAVSHTSNQGALHEQDAYRETLVPDDRNAYLYGEGVSTMDRNTIEIKVKTGSDTVVSIPVRFRYTIHGPVVTDPTARIDGTQANPGKSFAGTVTASQYEQVGLASEFWKRERATSVAEFKQAMSDVQLSQFNTMVADENGHIFFVASSRSGKLRGDGSPGNSVNVKQQPLDGTDPFNTWVSADPERPWTGVLTFPELPQAEDPSSGFFQNANNPPWTTAPGQIEKSDVPYYMRDGNDGTRSRRQRELLESASGLSLADADQIAGDVKVEFAGTLIDMLGQVAAATTNQRIIRGYDLLSTWNQEAEASSVAMPLFIAWVRGIDKAKLGNSDATQKAVTPQQASAPYPEGLVGQPGGYTTAQLTEVGQKMANAVQAVESANEGALAIPYGDLHTINWGSFSAPVDGGTNDAPTLFMTGCKNNFADEVLYAFPCPAGNGSGYVVDVDLSDGAMHTLKPTSASDDPDSSFYTINAEDFADRNFRDFPISPADVSAEATSTVNRTVDLDRPAPSMTISPGNHDFGKVEEGSTSAKSQPFTLTNDGTAPLKVDDAQLQGSEPEAFVLVADECSGAILDPASDCAIKVKFAPGSSGLKSARLVASGDAEDSPATVFLSGMGTSKTEPGQPSIQISPDSFDFGHSKVGTGPGTSAAFTVFNAGDGPLLVTGTTIGASNPGAFSVSEDACSNQELPAGEGCVVTVAFEPRSSGLKSASLMVSGNAGNSPATATLTGTGDKVLPPRKAGTSVMKVAERITRSGHLKLRIKCSLTRMDRCAGRFTVSAKRRALNGRARAGRGNQQVKIGSRPYSSGPGSRWIKIKLNRKTRLALRHRALVVRVKWTTRQPSGKPQHRVRVRRIVARR